MGAGGHFVHALSGKRNTERQDILFGAQLGQGPVVKAAAPADALTCIVECQHRHQNHIGPHFRRARERMAGAKRTGLKRISITPMAENQRLTVVDHYRQRQRPACLAERGHHRQRAHFISDGQITGDHPHATTGDTGLNVPGKAMRGIRLGSRSRRLPAFTGGFAEGLFMVVQISQGIAL